MDPPLISESSFSAANPAAYSLAEIWPFGPEQLPGSGLRVANLGPNPAGFAETSANRDGSMEESTVTEQSAGGGGRKRRDVSPEDESSKMVSTSSANELVRFLGFFFIFFILGAEFLFCLFSSALLCSLGLKIASFFFFFCFIVWNLSYDKFKRLLYVGVNYEENFIFLLNFCYNGKRNNDFLAQFCVFSPSNCCLLG